MLACPNKIYFYSHIAVYGVKKGLATKYKKNNNNYNKCLSDLGICLFSADKKCNFPYSAKKKSFNFP